MLSSLFLCSNSSCVKLSIIFLLLVESQICFCFWLYILLLPRSILKVVRSWFFGSCFTFFMQYMPVCSYGCYCLDWLKDCKFCGLNSKNIIVCRGFCKLCNLYLKDVMFYNRWKSIYVLCNLSSKGVIVSSGQKRYFPANLWKKTSMVMYAGLWLAHIDFAGFEVVSKISDFESIDNDCLTTFI